MPKVPSTSSRSATPALRQAEGSGWALRIEGGRLSVVRERQKLGNGITLDELAIGLPHVTFPFDFKDGVERFRHHRGVAEVMTVSIESRILLSWLHQRSGGRIIGRAVDDALVLLGRTEQGTRYTIRARLLPDPNGPQLESEEPEFVLSLHDIVVYGPCDVPWPTLATHVLELLPPEMVQTMTLTTARIRLVRTTLLEALSRLGWKLPDVSQLRSFGVELRDGVLTARFLTPQAARAEVVTIDSDSDIGDALLRRSLERFISDFELKRHHGQVDRLLANGQQREALAEIYRALDGPPEPGFLAERLLGICASAPILREEGQRVCRVLLEQSPGYTPALCAMASIAMAEDRTHEAAVYLGRLVDELKHPAFREEATATDLSLAELLLETEPEEARVALERVLERAPDHEEALAHLIELARHAEDTEAVVPLLKRLLFSARSPESAKRAGLSLARHALRRHEPEEARVYMQVALEAAPNDIDAQLALAEVEAAAGYPHRAADLLESALRTTDPSAVDASVAITLTLSKLCLERLAEVGRARRALWRAADLHALGSADALALGRLSLEAADVALTLRFVERVDITSPLAVRAHCLRALALNASGRSEDAIASVVSALEVAPGDPEALELLDNSAADLEVRERLLHRLRAAAEAAPSGEPKAQVHHALGRLYTSLNLFGDAIKPLEVALDETHSPTLSAEVTEQLVSLYERYEMWDSLQELCASRLVVLKAPPERLPMLVRLGRVHVEQLGDPEEAARSLQEALQISPREPDALVAQWRVCEALDDLDGLVRVLRRLEAVHPSAAIRARAARRLTTLRTPSLPVDEATMGHGGDQGEPALEARHAYAAAVALADTGQTASAIELLRHHCRRHPEDTPARELLGLLDPP